MTASRSQLQVVPCLLNLEAHLLTSPFRNQVLLKCLRERFAAILNPDSTQFDATPAGACLLDPNVSLILQSPDTASLHFWKARQDVYPKLAPVALDLVSAPASQAFVERIFSVWTPVIWAEKLNNHISGAASFPLDQHLQFSSVLFFLLLFFMFY